MTPQSLFDIGTIIHKKGFETFFLCPVGNKEISTVLFTSGGQEQGLIYGLEYEFMGAQVQRPCTALLYLGHLFTDDAALELRFYMMAIELNGQLLDDWLCEGTRILQAEIASDKALGSLSSKGVMRQFASEHKCETIGYTAYASAPCVDTTNRPHVGMGECLVLPQDLQIAIQSLALRTSDPKAELASYTNKVQEACIK